jgi:hypothetical protein
MHRISNVLSFSLLCFLSIVPACSRSNNVGMVRRDGGGATGGTSGNGGVTGGTSGSGGATGGTSGSGGATGGTSGGGATGSLDANADTCAQLTQTAQAQFQTYLSSTSSLACQVDSDCSVLHLQSLNCISACGQIVGTAEISAVTAAASSVCSQYVGAGCPEIRLACPAFRIACDQGQCTYAIPRSADAGTGGSAGTGGILDGGGGSGAAGTGGTSGSDGGGAAFDSAVSSACAACGADELCVAYYDGLCKPLQSTCNKVSAETRQRILVNHENCFLNPLGNDVCGTRDGQTFWGCGAPSCPNETLQSDINCYGS